MRQVGHLQGYVYQLPLYDRRFVSV